MVLQIKNKNKMLKQPEGKELLPCAKVAISSLDSLMISCFLIMSWLLFDRCTAINVWWFSSLFLGDVSDVEKEMAMAKN